MRQPDINILQAVIAQVPDDRLRPLLLELLGVCASAPLASAPSPDGHKPDAAVTTTPSPVTKRPPGRPRIKPNAAATGARRATQLAAMPGRPQLIRDVMEGKLSRAAAARQFGTTARTISAWIEKFRREQEPAAPVASTDEHKRPEEIATPAPRGPTGETQAQRTVRLALKAARQRERDAERRQLRDAERAAQAAQLALPVGGNGHSSEDAARLAINAARPVPAKASGSITAEPSLAPALWQKAAERSPTAPWKSIVEEFGIPIMAAMEHCRARTMPPIAPAAAARFLEMAAS